ncbi:YadA C-terminal domain-containing protein [Vibrio scophthalmi]|uniref:YadA C-terminal domain-containing protein n=1 Tax=Vibrio scophthalmi TaxID=45658 RepID=UPI0038733D0A
MKKTILGLAISAVSFGSFANIDPEVPVMPENPHVITADQLVNLLNTDYMMDILGATDTEDPLEFSVEYAEDGVTPVAINVNKKLNPNKGGASIPLDGSFDKMDKQQVETLKREIKKGVKENMTERKIGREDRRLERQPKDGVVVPPYVGNPSHKLPTMDEKLEVIETMLTNNGATINTSPDGTLKTVSVIRDGEMHTLTIDTVSGHYMYGGETVKITGEHKDAIVRAAVEKTGLVGGIGDPIDVVLPSPPEDDLIDPIDVVIDPIKDSDSYENEIKNVVKEIQTNGSDEEKKVAMNTALEKTGSDYRVAAVISASGKQVVITDVDGNEVATMSEEDFKKAAADKQKDNEEYRNGGSDPAPVQPMPIVGEQPTGELAQTAYDAQQASISNNALAIQDLEVSVADLYNQIDRLDTRIDQTQALNAATVNARPMVANGDTAFGAGVGYSSGESALAIGVAHSFEDSAWSASGTVAITSDDTVAGAGVQYAF